MNERDERMVASFKKKSKDDDDDTTSIGCSGCGYSIVGCLFWPTLFLFCIITGLGVTAYGHYYHLSLSWGHGLEIHDEEVQAVP